ncbi:GNAT family N-acetyltransferase [Candidatus Moduliflexota bacterium]
MRGYITAVRRKLRTSGLQETFAIVAGRAYNSLFHGRLLLFRADITGNAVDSKLSGKKDGIKARTSIHELTADERSIFKGYGGESLLRLWEKRFQKGHSLFVVYHGGEVAGTGWIYEGGRKEFFTVPLAPGEAFIVAVFVLDPFRGKGLGTRILALILQRMKDDGFQRAYICTKEWNHFQKSIRRAGFELLGKVREIKMFGRVFQVWSECGGRDFP